MSVARLFLGGILPGVLVGLAIMTTAYFSAVKHNYPVEKKFEIKRVFVTFKKALLPLGMPVIILGGIFGGIFTPTEAAIVAVAYVMIIAVIQRSITFKNIPDMFMDVAVLSSVATFLVAGASLFAWVLASEQIPQKIATSLLETLQNKYLILLAINVLLLFVGTFLENISAIIILAPILMPIGEKLGMDPYHMAVIICFNLATGMATPPVGANLFVAGAIANTNLTQTSKGTIPYLIAMIIVLLLVTYIPAITVFLPNMFIPLK
jgi:C4-dicarboxylate transporter DctM subunit